MKALHINGNDLTLENVREVAVDGRPVLLAPDARAAVERARAVVDDLVENNRVAYAITTGVGKLADVRIAPEQIREVQVNLLRSHAVGTGEPLSEAETRAMMLLRANALAKGYSGVRPAVIEMLCEMLTHRVHPVIPSQGSVGASGDLAPLSHLGLVLIGEGEALYSDSERERPRARDSTDRTMNGAEALRRAKIKPLKLEAKEAVSLINGTQGMLAVGALALLAAETMVDSADVIGALTLDALRGTDVAFDERIHRVRPHPGQLQTARNLRLMLEGSQIRESHRDCARVQDAYSLRCMPQVHGAVRDALAYCRKVFEIEINSAVDNPLVFPDSQTRPASLAISDRVEQGFSPAKSHARNEGASAPEGQILSGGNFHGEPLAFALDFLAIALSALAGISERRIERLVNPALNEGLPPFLAPGAGLQSGFMMAQVTAASLVSENKVLAHPASVDSITTSGNKEDYVSMGMTAAIKLKQIVANTRTVLAIEALAAAQALDFLAPLRPGRRAQAAYDLIRSISPRVEHDRALANDFGQVAELIEKRNLAGVLN